MKVKERSHMSVASLLKEKHFLWHHIHYLYFYLYLLFDCLLLCHVKKNGKTWIIIFYSIPCANIITSPGSSIISSLKQNGVFYKKKSWFRVIRKIILAIFFNNNNHFTDRKCVGRGKLCLKIIGFYNK